MMANATESAQVWLWLSTARNLFASRSNESSPICNASPPTSLQTQKSSLVPCRSEQESLFCLCKFSGITQGARMEGNCVDKDEEEINHLGAAEGTV